MSITAEDAFYYSKLSQLGVEEWLPIKGHDFGYEVSNLGRVRSIPHTMANPAGTISGVAGRVLKGGLSRNRPMVGLSGPVGRSARMIHSLVAEAFIGPRPEKLVVCHNNGDPKDNCLCNLRYDTQRNNMADSIKHGTATKFDEQGQLKSRMRCLLADDDVQRLLYILATEDLLYSEVADKYGYSLNTVKQIGLGKVYSWVEPPELPDHLPKYTRKGRLLFKDGVAWRSTTSGLNADQIRDLRSRSNNGESVDELVLAFSLSSTSIRCIARGDSCTWADGPTRPAMWRTQRRSAAAA